MLDRTGPAVRLLRLELDAAVSGVRRFLCMNRASPAAAESLLNLMGK